MVVILTCFQDLGLFQPLTWDRPVAMLPVLNRPIIEHHIENFVEWGCSNFIVVAVEHPLVIREFLGDGSRWGATVKVVVFREPCGSSEVLERIGSLGEVDLTLMPSEVILDLDYDALTEFHGSHGASTTVVLTDLKLELHAGSDPKHLDFSCIRVENPVDTGMLLRRHADVHEGTAAEINCGSKLLRIVGPRDLWMANMAGVSGEFSRLGRRSMSTRQGDVWMGHHLQMAPGVTVGGPSLIGNHVRLNSLAKIGGYSVIGDGVIVDKGAEVAASVVTDYTYVGADTSVEHCILAGKLVHNVRIGQWVELGDPFLASDTRENIVVPWFIKLAEKPMAASLLLLTLPLWLAAGMIRLTKGKTFFEARPFLCEETPMRTEPPDELCRKKFVGFGNPSSLVGRLPMLLDVLRGRMRLVGVRPIVSKAHPVYQEDWTRLRHQAPVGVITPVDSEGLNSASEEEKIVAENYYVATRSFREDLKVFFKGSKTLLFRSLFPS